MNAVTAKRADALDHAGDPDRHALVAFVHDEATRAALVAALDASWSAASIAFGGIEDGIEYLAHDPSPRFLVIDLAGVAEPLAALDRLAEVCAPETVVVAVGEVNDVGLYRALIGAGVADYLVKPVAPDAFKASLQAATRKGHDAAVDKPAEASGKVLVVVGARGGVGTTTVASTLAWLLAEEHGRHTMLIDLDLHWGAAALALDVEASHGLCEALESPDRIDSLFVASAAAALGENLYLLCSEEPLEHSAAIRLGALERLSTELRRDFAYIVIDAPRAGPELLRHSFAEASGIAIVTDLSLAGLRDSTRLLDLAKSAAPSAKTMIVASRIGGARRNEVPKAEFEKTVGVPIAIVVPDDAKAASVAANTGKPLPKVAPGSKATTALRELALTLGEPASAEGRGLIGRLLRGTGLGRR